MSTQTLSRSLRALWWLPMIKGVLAVAAGIVALVWPAPTIVVLVVVLGVYLVVDAILNLVNARAMAGVPGRGAMILLGVLGLLVGALMLWHPGPMMRIVVTLVGAWVIVVGLVLMAVALLLTPLTRRAWLAPLVAGLVCVGLGLAGVIHPGFGARALGILIGAGVIVYGGVHIGLAIGLRRLSGAIDRTAPTVIEGEVVPDDRSGETTERQIEDGD